MLVVPVFPFVLLVLLATTSHGRPLGNVAGTQLQTSRLLQGALEAHNADILELKEGEHNNVALFGASAAVVPAAGSIIPGRYIAVLDEANPSFEDARTAAAKLVQEVLTAMKARMVSKEKQAAASTTVVAAVAAPATPAASNGEISVLDVLESAADSQATATAAAADTPHLMQIVLLQASATAARIARRSKLVKAVIPDRVVRQAGTPCAEVTQAVAGVTAPPSSLFRWPGCFIASTQIVWKGTICGADGAYIKWTTITAVNKSKRRSASACSLAVTSANATIATNWFGGCGVAPKYAPSLPTAICRGTGKCQDGLTPTMGTLQRSPLSYGEAVPNGIARIEAYTKAAGIPNITSSAQRVVVGVVDGGVDRTHPDINYVGGKTWLVGKVLPAKDVPDADVDNTAHGTHVAGTIGADNQNNGTGTVGVAPGVPIFSLKVLDGTGAGAMYDVLSAVTWAASAAGGKAVGINVINLSLTLPVSPADTATVSTVCTAFKQASDAGLVVTAAAGNFQKDLAGYLPAACPTVMAVTAMDPVSNKPVSSSNWLADTASAEQKSTVIAAPGAAVFSTVPKSKYGSSYALMTGTSMAAPAVAGVAANCIASGLCPTGATGLQKLAIVQAAAKERLQLAGYRAHGFAGDAQSTANGKYYGYLTWAGKF